MNRTKMHPGGKVLIGIIVVLLLSLLGWTVKNLIEKGGGDGGGTTKKEPVPHVCKLCQNTNFILMKCTVCMGKKTNKCKKCNGTGKTPGIIWGENPCKDCEEKGQTSCLVCEGVGQLRLPCPSCSP